MDLSKMSEPEIREWIDCASTPSGALDRMQEAWPVLARRLAAAEAIVDKLPKTADGVSVGPGELVYTLYGAEWYVQDQNTAAESWMDGDPAGPISECYSTREAAEAARQPAPKGERDE